MSKLLQLLLEEPMSEDVKVNDSLHDPNESKSSDTSSITPVPPMCLSNLLTKLQNVPHIRPRNKRRKFEDVDSVTSFTSATKNPFLYKPPFPLSDDLQEPNEFNVRLVKPYQLFGFQKFVVQWLQERETRKIKHPFFKPVNGALLAMEMGLGKTICVLISVILNKPLQQTTLYICPKGLMLNVANECYKFFGTQIRVMVYHKDVMGNEAFQLAYKHFKDVDIVISNYDMISQAIMNEDSHFPFQWDKIILDESHEVRSKHTQRFKNLMQLKSQWKVCLSGTPIYNSIADIFHQLQFCGFIMPPRMNISDKTFQLLELHKMVLFIHQKDVMEHVQLPPKFVHSQPSFELNANERELHTWFLSHARWLCSTPLTHESHLEANVAVLRALQVCSGAYLMTAHAKMDDAESHEQHESHPFTNYPSHLKEWVHNRMGTSGMQSSKMMALLRLLSNLQGKVVIFANWVSTLRLAEDVIERNGMANQTVFVQRTQNAQTREDLFNEFRTNPSKRFLLTTSKLGNVGRNLTEACIVIFLEIWYTASAQEQGSARVHRIGQIHPVHIFYLLAANSIEERVLQIAMGKQETTEHIEAMGHNKGFHWDQLQCLLK